MEGYRVYTRTERSRGFRHPRNEDSHLFCEFSFAGDIKIQMLAVADGLGGLADGDVASRNAVQGFARSLYEKIIQDYLDWDGDYDSAVYPAARMEEIVKEAIRDANRTVCDQARDTLRPSGTTLSVVLLTGKYAVIANVGDSPVYLYRARAKKQKLLLKSQLQTKAEQDVEAGLYSRYSDEYYDNEHIVCHILGEYTRLDSDAIYCRRVGNLEPGDMVLVGSDGAFGRMMEDEIQQFLEEENTDFVLEDIFERARQDKNDDQTAILCVKDAPTEIGREAPEW